jgi:hypothetical protein
MCIGEADLDEMILAAGLRYGSVVELLDDLVADVTRLEAIDCQLCSGCQQHGDLPSKADTAASPGRVPEDPARADLVGRENGGEFMLVHVLGDVGYVKIGVALVGELLELGVE